MREGREAYLQQKLPFCFLDGKESLSCSGHMGLVRVHKEPQTTGGASDLLHEMNKVWRI